jgi:hypothetical protein
VCAAIDKAEQAVLGSLYDDRNSANSARYVLVPVLHEWGQAGKYPKLAKQMASFSLKDCGGRVYAMSHTYLLLKELSAVKTRAIRQSYSIVETGCYGASDLAGKLVKIPQ